VPYKQINNVIKYKDKKQPPTIVICRYSVFEKLEITKKYIGERMILEN
jgi:hypothetical protein